MSERTRIRKVSKALLKKAALEIPKILKDWTEDRLKKAGRNTWITMFATLGKHDLATVKDMVAKESDDEVLNRVRGAIADLVSFWTEEAKTYHEEISKKLQTSPGSKDLKDKAAILENFLIHEGQPVEVVKTTPVPQKPTTVPPAPTATPTAPGTTTTTTGAPAAPAAQSTTASYVERIMERRVNRLLSSHEKVADHSFTFTVTAKVHSENFCSMECSHLYGGPKEYKCNVGVFNDPYNEIAFFIIKN